MLSSKVLSYNCSFTRVVLLYLSTTVILINCMYIVGTLHHEKPLKQCKCESNPQYSFRRKVFLGNHFKFQAEMTNVCILYMSKYPFSKWQLKTVTCLTSRTFSNDPDGTRTHNPQLRRLMPYPLGQWATYICPLGHRSTIPR